MTKICFLLIKVFDGQLSQNALYGDCMLSRTKCILGPLYLGNGDLGTAVTLRRKHFVSFEMRGKVQSGGS